MKRKIIITLSCVCVIAVLVALAIHFGLGKSVEEEPIKPYRFDSELSTDMQTISNGSLKLEFDPTTTHFTLTDRFGNQWTSNPEGSDAAGRKELQSTVVISYTDNKGVSTQLDNYKSSVEKGNYSYEVFPEENKIRVDYTIGQIEKVYYLPLAVPYERYEALFNAVSEEGQREMKSAYRILNYEKLQGKDELKELLELYPDLEEHDVVVLRENTQEWKKEVVEGYLAEIGYTAEQYEEDLTYYNVETSEDKPAVNLSVYYILDGDDFVVKVPFDEIQYYSKYPLTDCRVLPFMCSAGNQENGFLFVPDGSGSLIYFNNEKYNQTQYTAQIYGWDYGISRKVIVNDPEVRFPVYGISFEEKNQSMLCIVEEGESYGYIEADVAGRKHNYNYVTAGFTIVHGEQADVAERSNSGVYLYEEQLPKGEAISLRYRAVDSSSYVDMAKDYREYLFGKYPSLAESVSGKLPMAVELIGAITKTQQVLGFPKDKPYALTTYKEMQEIIQELNDAGLTDLSVIINGWFNEGVVHEVADDVDLISVLGSKKDFKNMLSAISKSNQAIYLKADVTFVYKNGLFDSYSTRKDSTKYISREIAEMQDISNIFYSIDDFSDYHYLAKPKFSMDTLDSYLKEIKELGNSNVAFTSIGNILAADYNRKEPVSRETVKKQHIDKLGSMREAGSKTAIYEGNAYLIPYADLVINMPLKSQGSNIVDQEIPFFSIVLHGHVNYTGDALNITGDFITNLLKTVESGAGLYCVLMDAPSSALQDTESTEFYGANFDSWKEDVISYYQRFEKDFAGLYGQTIANHEIVAENVTMTEYEDGTQVYVNYRTADYKLSNGTTIPAQDWVVIGGKGGN